MRATVVAAALLFAAATSLEVTSKALENIAQDAEARLRDERNRISEAMFAAVGRAEKICARETRLVGDSPDWDTTRQKIIDRNLARERLRALVEKGQADLPNAELIVESLENELRLKEIEVEVLRERAEGGDDSVRDPLANEQERLTALKNNARVAREKVLVSRQELESILTEYSEMWSSVHEFDRCVQRTVEMYAQSDEMKEFLSDHFPQYAGVTAGIEDGERRNTGPVTVEFSHVDDEATLYVNGQAIFKSRWGIQGPIEGAAGVDAEHTPGGRQGNSGPIDITRFLRPGQNALRITLWNIESEEGAVSLTVVVQQGDRTIYSHSFSRDDPHAGMRFDHTVMVPHAVAEPSQN